MRYNYDFLKDFCIEHEITLIKDYSNEKINRDSLIEGKCKSNGCNEICNKKLREFINTNSYCDKHTKENRKIKVKKTCLEKYGVDNILQSKDIRDKIKNTCLEKYGVENISQNESIKKIKKIQLQKNYGVEGLSNPIIKDKKKNTCLEKYGVEYACQSDIMKENTKNTCLEKYGVDHHTQNSEIMDKCSKKAYKIKEYILPSGNMIKIQGYENFALDELLQNGILEEDIINGCKNVPEIWYDDDIGHKHRHYVDIYIKSQNRCIEIKSTWTFQMAHCHIFEKQDAAKQLGYDYEVWVFAENGELLDTYE